MKYDQAMIDDLLDYLIEGAKTEQGMNGIVRMAAQKAAKIREPMFRTSRLSEVLA